jgi:hypothetical protein
MGSAAFSSGVDIDGESWTNPPSMGCDEPMESNLVGPLSVFLALPGTQAYVNHAFVLSAQVSGQAAKLAWDFGDASPAINAGYQTSHIWTNEGHFNVVVTAYNTDNPAGVSTNLLLTILPVLSPHLSAPTVRSNAFQFQFSTQTNLDYIVQWTTNLSFPIAWQLFQNGYSLSNGVVTITDNIPPNGRRFYRVRVL